MIMNHTLSLAMHDSCIVIVHENALIIVSFIHPFPFLDVKDHAAFLTATMHLSSRCCIDPRVATCQVTPLKLCRSKFMGPLLHLSTKARIVSSHGNLPSCGVYVLYVDLHAVVAHITCPDFAAPGSQPNADVNVNSIAWFSIAH